MTLTREKITGDHVLQTPAWILVIRIFQVLISVGVLGLAARLIHEVSMDEVGLALAIALITFIVVAYVLITEKVSSCHKAYHIVAVLTLDGLLMVLWLATFAAAAARRGEFTETRCYTGSSFNTEPCYFDGTVGLLELGAAMLSAIAGLGALVWVLFIVTFVWTLVMLLQGRKQGRFAINLGTSTSSGVQQPVPATGDNVQMAARPAEPHQQQPQQPYPVYQPHGTQPHGTQPHGAQPQQPSPQSPYNPPVQQYPPPGQYNPSTSPPPMQGYPPQNQYAYGHYPPAQQPSPQPQGQQAPSPSVSPYNSDVGTHQHTASPPPPPQELGPQSYQAVPQEMPHHPYQNQN